MSLVALQPSGSPVARAHYIDTIESPVSQETLYKFLEPSQIQKIKEIYGEEPVPTWGLTPGQREVNVGKWERLDIGSVTLFSADKQIFASAVVTMKFRNFDLAKHLWGTHTDDVTWEYMYLLDEVYGHRISYNEFNSVAGYQPNFVIQGFNVLSKEKSNAILSAFELQSFTHTDTKEQEKVEDISFINSQLDIEGKIKLRGEQQALRKVLFGSDRILKCSVCGEEYPRELLVAAHIKKRSRCSDEEKRDLSSVATPMCKMGCDELFERGFIGIKDNSIEISPHIKRTSSLDLYLKRLERSKPITKKGQSKYYEWHLKNIFKGSFDLPRKK